MRASTLVLAAIIGVVTVIATPFPDPDDSAVTSTTQLDTTTLFCCDQSDDPSVSHVCEACGPHASEYAEHWIQQADENGGTTLVLVNDSGHYSSDAGPAEITGMPTSAANKKRQGDGVSGPATRCVGLGNGNAQCVAGTRTWIQTAGAMRSRPTIAVDKRVKEAGGGANCCVRTSRHMTCYGCDVPVERARSVAKREETYDFHLECSGPFDRETFTCANGQKVDGSICLVDCSCSNVGEIQCHDHAGCTPQEVTKMCTQGSAWWGCGCSHLSDQQPLSNVVPARPT